MSDPFFDHLEQSRTAWVSQYWADDIVVRRNAGWHFCFALLPIGPAAKNRIYSFGSVTRMLAKPSHVLSQNEFQYHYYPSTEQFYGGNGQTQHPVQFVSASNGETQSAAAVIACDANGMLWVYGGIPSYTREAYNQLGLGPDADEFLGFDNDFRTVKTARSTLTPVYGEQGDLLAVKFKAVGVAGDYGDLGTPASACLSALDSDGAIWFSGTACPRNFATTSQFPDDTDGVLTYFRKAEFHSYIDATGEVELEEPMRFSLHAVGAMQIMAISTNGKLYLWGSFWLGKEITSATPHEVSGFVDTVAVTNQGSGYSQFSTTATASDPDYANGTKATFSVSVSSGKVVGITINNPGYGYASAPTVTISGVGSGATASVTLFDRTWLHASCSRHGRSFSAIDSDGKMYSWGPRSPAVYEDAVPVIASPAAPMAAAYQSDGGYVQVERSQSGGIALTSGGTIDTWGSPEETPTLQNQERLTALVSTSTFIKVATASNAIAALANDGKVFTAGSEAQCGRGFSTSERFAWGAVSGSAVWSSLWGGFMGFILNRDESFDADGNRIDPIPPGLT